MTSPKTNNEWTVVLSYDVQKSFLVKAEDEYEAYKKAYDWDYIDVDENWEFLEHIETKEGG
jgi:hypothetical protein|tara:strand:- start:300 stop:482 length:183 start_codon:yes stop_codon:yes gene_type:complete